MNDCDKASGAMCLSLSTSMCYLIDSSEYPKDILKTLYIDFGKYNEPSFYKFGEHT